MQNSHRAGERMCTEKHPGETDQIESNESINRFFPKWHRRFVDFDVEHFLTGEIHSVQSTPDNIIPGSSVPETTQQHRKHVVEVGSEFAFSVSSQ